MAEELVFKSYTDDNYGGSQLLADIMLHCPAARNTQLLQSERRGRSRRSDAMNEKVPFEMVAPVVVIPEPHPYNPDGDDAEGSEPPSYFEVIESVEEEQEPIFIFPITIVLRLQKEDEDEDGSRSDVSEDDLDAPFDIISPAARLLQQRRSDKIKAKARRRAARLLNATPTQLRSLKTKHIKITTTFGPSRLRHSWTAEDLEYE